MSAPDLFVSIYSDLPLDVAKALPCCCWASCGTLSENSWNVPVCALLVCVCERESVSSRGEGRCPQVSTSAPSTSQTHAQSSTQRRHSAESSRDSLEPHTHFPPLRLRTELTEKEAKTAAIFGNIETRKLDTEHSGKHVQLGQTGAGWQQQRRRDVPDRYGGTADSLHQEAAAAGRDLSLPWLPLPGPRGCWLPE